MLICTTRLAFPSSVLQDRPTACSRHLPDLRGLLTRVSHNRRLISSPAPPNPNAPASAWVACLPGASRPAAPFPWSNPSQARPGGVDETALRTAQEYVKPPAVPPYRYAQAENPGLCPWRSGVHPPPLLSRRHPEKPQPLTIPLEKEGLGLRLVVAACVTGHGCPSAEPARRRPQRTLHPMFRKRQKKKKRDSELGHVATAAGRKCAWGFSSITARKGISNACVLVVAGDDGPVNPNGSVHRVAHLT